MAIAPKAAPEARHRSVPEERTARILADGSIKIDSDY
jgi:hypothetical protein